MKKSCLLIVASSLILAACNGEVSQDSSLESPSSEASSENSSVVSPESTLGTFLKEASSSYSFKGTAEEVSSSSGVTITTANYLDFAAKEDYFSITTYLEVLNGLGTLSRNSISSDIRYKKYSYEGNDVVSSSYLTLNNEIGYDVKKDSYGYTTAWSDSFLSFFSILKEEDFLAEENNTYTLDLTKIDEKVGTAILYQTGYLSPTSVTSFSFASLSLKENDGVINEMTFGLADVTDEAITSAVTIDGSIITGTKAEKDVKVEEIAAGDKIEELDAAFKSLQAYNFDFDLKVTISRIVQKEYATKAEADGSKIVSSKFAYVKKDSGLEYYTSPTDEGVYKTMETVSGGKLEDVLPSFDIATNFFSKSGDNTYILSTRAERCSKTSKDFSVYQPFSLSFSKVTVKLGDNSMKITGVSGTYQFDISYTNIGQKTSITYENSNVLGFGDYVESYASWVDAYEEFATLLKKQLSLNDLDSVYAVLNNIPVYYTYRMASSPYIMDYQFKFGRYIYGSMFEYSNKSNRDLDLQGVQTFYLANGFQKSSSSTETEAVLTKDVTVGENSFMLGLRILTGTNGEIPIIGVFPVVWEE